MIEVSNVNFTDTDVDPLMKSTNLSFPIPIGINYRRCQSSIGIPKAKFPLWPVSALFSHDSCFKKFIAKKFFPVYKLIAANNKLS